MHYVKGLPVPSMVSQETLGRVDAQPDRKLVWIALKPGVDRAHVVDEITGIAIQGGLLPVAGPVILDVRAAQALGVARAAAAGILSLAVVVAIMGAAATAALSLAQSTREHATLRALGLARRDLERMLGARILLVAGTSAGFGVVVGSFLGIVASRMIIASIGVDQRLSIPFAPVLVVIVATVWAVRLAALAPVERASFVPPTRALARA